MIIIGQTMGLPLLQQKQKRSVLQAHTHTPSQKRVYDDLSLLRKNKNTQGSSINTKKAPICSLRLPRISRCGAPPEALQHTHTHTYTSTCAHANTERSPVCASGCLAHPLRRKMTCSAGRIFGSEELQIL